MEYKKWLAVKIAAVFEMDLLAFNLTEGVNRANGKNMQAQTDQGHIALAKTVAEFLTRELVWEFDENHAFEFGDLTDRDELAQAQVDQINMAIGVTFPNEIRARDGQDPVPWGDVPYVAGSVSSDGTIKEPTEPTDPNGNEPQDEDITKPGKGDNPKDDEQEAAKKQLPFVVSPAARRTRSARLGYLSV